MIKCSFLFLIIRSGIIFLMPSVRNCNFNSHKTERKSIYFLLLAVCVFTGCCTSLTAAPRPPLICLPKSAKAGVKSGPLEMALESTARDGALCWFICAAATQSNIRPNSRGSSVVKGVCVRGERERECVCAFLTKCSLKGDPV